VNFSEGKKLALGGGDGCVGKGAVLFKRERLTYCDEKEKMGSLLVRGRKKGS